MKKLDRINKLVDELNELKLSNMALHLTHCIAPEALIIWRASHRWNRWSNRNIRPRRPKGSRAV